jgi:hypothetical protein
MKTIKFLFLFTMMVQAGYSQPYASGITNYPKTGSDYLYCSAGLTSQQGAIGHVIAEYNPSASGSTEPNFAIIKTDMYGGFSIGAPSDFYSEYFFTMGGFNCNATQTQAIGCYGVTICEARNAGLEYGVAASFDEGLMFAKIDSYGSVTGSNFYPFPSSATNPSKALICRVGIPATAYYLVGSCQVSSTERRMYILKLNTAGAITWSKTYNYGTSDALLPNAITLPANGGTDLVVVGTCFDGSTYDGFFTIINGTNGNVTSFDTYDFGGDERFHSISQVTSAVGSQPVGYAIGGYNDGAAPSDYGWMMRVDLSGTKQWEKVSIPSFSTGSDSIVGICSRYSSAYSQWEHYGALPSSAGITVVKVDDNGAPFSQGLNTNNEFVYDEIGISSSNPDAPAAIDFDNANTLTKGLHVYGNTQLAAIFNNQAEMINATFNGLSGRENTGAGQCIGTGLVVELGTVSTPANALTGKTSTGLSVSNGLSACSNHSLSNNITSINPTNPCTYTNTLQPGAIQSRNVIAGVKENENSIISIYPSIILSEQKFRLKLDRFSSYKVRLESIEGVRLSVWEGDYSQDNSADPEMSVASLNLASGVYFLTVTTDNKNTVFKIILSN